MQNTCLDYSQLNFFTNSNCHIIITHLNSFLSCFILIFLLLRCTAAKLPKEQTGQRNCCCCRYTGPHIQQQQVGPKVSLFKFQDLGVNLTWTSIAGHHSLENASALRGVATLQWRGCAMRWALWQDRGTEGSSNHTHSDEERRFMYQNRPSKSHQLPFDQGVQIVISPSSVVYDDYENSRLQTIWMKNKQHCASWLIITRVLWSEM